MTEKSAITNLARAGMYSKGAVYVMMGLLTVMAAFHLFGKSEESADKMGVFQFVYEQTGGKVLLAVLAGGLICYVIYRFIETFSDKDTQGNDRKNFMTRFRYFFSAIAYGSLTFHVIKMLTVGAQQSRDRSKEIAAELMSHDYGTWIVALLALKLVGIGVFQIYYGLSEKHRKHVDTVGKNKRLLLNAGIVGYVSRGIVWLLIAWLFFRAAFKAESTEAGGTAKAFSLLNDGQLGSYFLAAIGLGLISYGVFNFVRAWQEKS